MNENNEKQTNAENKGVSNFEKTMKSKKFIHFKLLDAIFIAVALVLSCMFFLKPSSYAGGDKKLIVFVGEKEVQIPFVDQTIDFKKDFYDVDFKKYNISKDIILEVQDKKARVITSDCPDKVCVNSSWATNCGHMIICMPNSFGVLIDCKGNVNENK